MAIKPVSPMLSDMQWCWNGKHIPLKKLDYPQLMQIRKFILSRKAKGNDMFYGFLWYSWLDAVEYTIKSKSYRNAVQSATDNWQKRREKLEQEADNYFKAKFPKQYSMLVGS